MHQRIKNIIHTAFSHDSFRSIGLLSCITITIHSSLARFSKAVSYTGHFFRERISWCLKVNIISLVLMHTCQTIVCYDNRIWTKLNNTDNFDIAMGSFHGAEMCDLVGLYILDRCSTISQERCPKISLERYPKKSLEPCRIVILMILFDRFCLRNVSFLVRFANFIQFCPFR